MARWLLFAITLFPWGVSGAFGAGINVKDFGAKGDGATDDTAALKAAFEAAAKGGRSQQYPGSAYYVTSPEVFFPSGHYVITAALTPTVDTMRGEGHAVLEQKTPDQDVFYAEWAWRHNFVNLQFLGGRTHLNLGNPNIDSGFLVVENCKFQMSRGPAIQVRKGSNSTFTQILNCQFINCDQVLITYTDWTLMKACWISGGAHQENEAMIENRGAKMTLENILGVPNVNGLDQRWIDNYGSVTCQDFRFGGEGAGFTPIVNFAKYSPQLGGPTVILEDCWVSALGNNKRKCAVYCEEIPNLLEIRNCNLAGAPPVLISEKIDPQTYFQARPGMLRFAFANNLGEFADQIPEMLRNPVLNEVVETEPGLSEEETRTALEKAVAEWLARPKGPEAPGEWKGHTPKTDPAEYQEISFDKYRWDLEDDMDGTSEKNAKYLAVAPAGDDVLIMRRISPRNNWPHVLIRDVKIDLDRFPFLTLQQKPTGAPAAFAVKAIDKESGVMLTLEETTHQSPTDVYRAYNLRDLFQLRGQRTFDLKFYYLATAWREGASPTPDNLLEAQPGEYTVLDFLRAEAE